MSTEPWTTYRVIVSYLDNSCPVDIEAESYAIKDGVLSFFYKGELVAGFYHWEHITIVSNTPRAE